jgi:hypothetical protein
MKINFSVKNSLNNGPVNKELKILIKHLCIVYQEIYSLKKLLLTLSNGSQDKNNNNKNKQITESF